MLYRENDERVLIDFLKLYLQEFEEDQQKKELHKFDSDILSKENHKYFAYEFSDLGNARRVTDTYGDMIRYCPGKGWCIWNDTVWELDEKGYIYHLIEKRLCDMKAEMRATHERGAAALKPVGYMNLYQFAEIHVRKNQERRRINAAEELARHQLELCIANDDFDRDKLLLNAANGVVDLRTGGLLPHRREDYITRVTPVLYDPDALCPTWMAFLLEIMGGHVDLVEYLQRIIGYCLTGDISEQKIIICYGTGSNGKSTLIETIHALLGDYSKATKFKTFTER